MGKPYSKHIYATKISEGKQGESGIYRKFDSKENLITTTEEKHKTLQELYLQNMREYPDKDFLGTRFDPSGKLTSTYNWLTYKEVEEKAKNIGSGIINLNLTEEKAQYKDFKIKFVGIYSRNSLEWKLVDTANILYRFTTMPIYDTLGVDATEFMFNQTELSTCFMTCNHVKEISEKIRDGTLKFLKTIVILDEWNLTPEIKTEAKGVNLLTLNEVEKAGKENQREFEEAKPEDIIFFSYTSGTTGVPKGAMISNRNIIAGLAGGVDVVPLDQFTTHLSYLPLVHIFERIIVCITIYRQGRIGFYGGDPRTLTSDLGALKPDFFISVPRLYNKFYEMITKKINSLTGVKGALAKKALETKRYYFKHGGHVKHSVYDPLVFSKIKQIMGGNCKYMLTGSAPISTEVREYLSLVFCCHFAEGYGQTECMGGEFLAHPEDNIFGHVGGPAPHIEFKVEDVPEMNYLSTDKDENGVPTPRGELLVRSAAVIPGYYKNDEETAKLITKDGWMRSGDIVMILPETNAIRIVDRRKNIFKLSIGEYVAPDKLEQNYKLVPEISDIFVYGDSFKNYLVAAIYAEEAELKGIAQKLGLDDSENLRENERVKDYFVKALEDLAKELKLKGFEKIKKVYLNDTPFAELGLLTTTFKMKRHDAREYFKEILEKLYL